MRTCDGGSAAASYERHPLALEGDPSEARAGASWARNDSDGLDTQAYFLPNLWDQTIKAIEAALS